MVRLLLDTHVFVWMHAAPELLSRRARDVLVDAESELLLSCVVPWELGIKAGQGKLRLPEPVDVYCASRARAARMKLVDIRFAHVFEAVRLPDHHRDPFDRMLVAQARVERVPILSGDRALRAYDVEVVPA